MKVYLVPYIRNLNKSFFLVINNRDQLNCGSSSQWHSHLLKIAYTFIFQDVDFFLVTFILLCDFISSVRYLFSPNSFPTTLGPFFIC